MSSVSGWRWRWGRARPVARRHAEESICCLRAAEYISQDDSSGCRNPWPSWCGKHLQHIVICRNNRDLERVRQSDSRGVNFLLSLFQCWRVKHHLETKSCPVPIRPSLCDYQPGCCCMFQDKSWASFHHHHHLHHPHDVAALSSSHGNP